MDSFYRTKHWFKNNNGEFVNGSSILVYTQNGGEKRLHKIHCIWELVVILVRNFISLSELSSSELESLGQYKYQVIQHILRQMKMVANDYYMYLSR